MTTAAPASFEDISTNEIAVSVLADLEGVSHAAAFASGLAAENAVLQAYLKPGDEVITPLDVYGGTYRLFERVRKRSAGFDLGVRAARGQSIIAQDSRYPAWERTEGTRRTKTIWIPAAIGTPMIV